MSMITYQYQCFQDPISMFSLEVNNHKNQFQFLHNYEKKQS